MADDPWEDVPWKELEGRFGAEAVGVIDRAIGAHLAQYPNGIPRDEYYLVSEGLTYAVMMALRENGVRFTDVVSRLPR